jgi:hypothetical protein
VSRLLDFLFCRPGRPDYFTTLEDYMSALTDAIDTLTASVDAANERITSLLQPLQTALASAQSELADLKVQDDADKASLESALTDATTATSRILDEVSQVDALGAETTPPTV